MFSYYGSIDCEQACSVQQEQILCRLNNNLFDSK